MVNRLLNLPKRNSFFLLGPRGTGKSTLINSIYSPTEPSTLHLDLLDIGVEDHYRLNPNDLYNQIKASDISWVVIDEIQKLPRLLDVVHKVIEETNVKFVLSGSSARKLKKGGANLLAGRAFMYNLHPFTHVELGKDFNLGEVLSFGTMPRLFSLEESEKHEFLKVYSLTYLKEEIKAEQIVRKLDPFRQFLEVAAQMNGHPVNFSKIAREIGVGTVTVQNYFNILEDTLLGFFVMPYNKSIRKSQRGSPKFYFFDTGICRSLRRVLDVPLVPQIVEYGNAFEHFVILEIIRLADYHRKQWKFYYLKTKDGCEIDLIIETSSKTICIEIKSTEKVVNEDIKHLTKLGSDIPNSKLFCFSREKIKKLMKQVLCIEWKDGIKELLKH